MQRRRQRRSERRSELGWVDLKFAVGALGLMWIVVGCSRPSEPVDGAWSTAGDAWSDAGIVDASSLDTAELDTSAAAVDAADVALLDTTLSDTGTADTATPDTGTPDVGTPDTSKPDVGQPDTSGPDTSGGACQQKRDAYELARAKALKCTSDFQCYAPAGIVDGQGFVFGAPEFIGCACGRYYSDLDLAGQSLADLNAEYMKLGCKTMCPTVECVPLDTQIGRCQSGNCLTTTATCKEMEVLVAAAVSEGRSCKADADCSNFGMQGEIPCGCPVNVNLAKLAPGKPLFLYVTMITRAYKKQNCAQNVTCACAAIGKGACVKGMCVTK